MPVGPRRLTRSEARGCEGAVTACGVALKSALETGAGFGGETEGRPSGGPMKRDCLQLGPRQPGDRRSAWTGIGLVRTALSGTAAIGPALIAFFFFVWRRFARDAEPDHPFVHGADVDPAVGDARAAELRGEADRCLPEWRFAFVGHDFVGLQRRTRAGPSRAALLPDDRRTRRRAVRGDDRRSGPPGERTGGLADQVEFRLFAFGAVFEDFQTARFSDPGDERRTRLPLARPPSSRTPGVR